MKTEKKINIITSSQQYLKLLNNYYNHRKSRETIKTARNSSSIVNIKKNLNDVPYSIKPLFCSVPKDVSLHEIFVNMMNSSFKINGNKSIYIKISQEELEIRNYILNSIQSFLNKNGIQKKILCSIIFLYDILTIKNKEQKLLSSFEEIGIGATLLTLKFLCGKKKSFFTIKNLSNLFLNENISQKYNEIEINCLKLIGYYLSYASPISFMDIFFLNGIIFSNENLKTEECSRIYDLVIEIIGKIMIISNEYIKHNPLCLCACIVTYAREIYNLEKWPPILTQVFGVNFNSFENIYNEFHELIILTKNKEKSKEKKNNHKKENSQIFDDIEDNKDEMKLQTSSSVVQNIYGYTTPIKMENQKGKKYINIYYNNNFDFNKLNSHNKKISSDMYIKSTKNRKLKNNFYDNSHEQNINGKKIEEMEIEIPYLNNKKNNSLTSLYENKLNDSGNKDNKINKRMLTKNKEDDYSNVATSENSGNYTKNNFRQNYKKNFIISYNNKNGQQIDNKYNQQQYIESRYDNSDKKYIYENKPIPKTSQKKYPKNFNKWSSIKKFYKLKEGGTSLNDYFCPNTETKPFYTKKIYK